MDNDAVYQLKRILTSLNRDRYYYESDIEFEYTLFEQNIKKYCDTYFECSEIFFNSLTAVLEFLIGIDEEFLEDISRPAELLIYFIAKIYYLAGDDLKKIIAQWKKSFFDQYSEEYLITEYVEPLLDDNEITPGDKYYLGYDDFNRAIKQFSDINEI